MKMDHHILPSIVSKRCREELGLGDQAVSNDVMICSFVFSQGEMVSEGIIKRGIR